MFGLCRLQCLQLYRIEGRNVIYCTEKKMNVTTASWMLVTWVVTTCGRAVDTSVAKRHAVSIFRG